MDFPIPHEVVMDKIGHWERDHMAPRHGRTGDRPFAPVRHPELNWFREHKIARPHLHSIPTGEWILVFPGGTEEDFILFKMKWL
jgi:hypothetical protein